MPLWNAQIANMEGCAYHSYVELAPTRGVNPREIAKYYGVALANVGIMRISTWHFLSVAQTLSVILPFQIDRSPLFALPHRAKAVGELSVLE